MTKAQREALTRVNAAQPMATLDEYEAMSSYQREGVRKRFGRGYDADGIPQIRLQGVRVSYKVAQFLVARGFALATYSYRRSYAILIPTFKAD